MTVTQTVMTGACDGGGGSGGVSDGAGEGGGGGTYLQVACVREAVCAREAACTRVTVCDSNGDGNGRGTWGWRWQWQCEGWHGGDGESTWEGWCKGKSVSKEEKRLCNEQLRWWLRWWLRPVGVP